MSCSIIQCILHCFDYNHVLDYHRNWHSVNVPAEHTSDICQGASDVHISPLCLALREICSTRSRIMFAISHRQNTIFAILYVPTTAEQSEISFSHLRRMTCVFMWKLIMWCTSNLFMRVRVACLPRRAQIINASIISVGTARRRGLKAVGRGSAILHIFAAPLPSHTEILSKFPVSVPLKRYALCIATLKPTVLIFRYRWFCIFLFFLARTKTESFCNFKLELVEALEK